MGALRAKSILMIILVGLIPVALATDAFVISGNQGGWSSFHMTPKGTELTLILESELDGTGSFGIDLYSASTAAPTAVRVNLDGGGYALRGEVLEQDFDLLVPDVPVVGGTGGIMSLSGNGFGCTQVQMTAYLTMQRYEIALRNCTHLDQPLRGIAYGAYSGSAGHEWQIVAGSGATFEIVEFENGAYSLSVADFEGTALHADAPFGEILYAPYTTATIGPTTGFTGSFFISDGEAALSYSYQSPLGERPCPCLSISEVGAPGTRTFVLNTTAVSTPSMFVLAGVDARLPPS